MFAKPESGWTNFTIGDNDLPVSYVTDVPTDVLNAFIRFFKLGCTQSVSFDAEGWDWYLVIDRYSSYVIIDKDELIVKRIKINATEMAKDFINDLEANYEDWTHWSAWEDEPMDYKEEITKLKELIANQLNS